MKQMEKMLKQQIEDNYLGEKEGLNQICTDLMEDFYDSVSMWEISRDGIIPALTKWLQGLPSKLDLLFYDSDIEKLFENWAIEDTTDAPNRYYAGLAEMIYDNAQ